MLQDSGHSSGSMSSSVLEGSLFDKEKQLHIGIGSNPEMGCTPLTQFLFNSIPALKCLDVQTYPYGYIFGLCDTVREVERILRNERSLCFQGVLLQFNKVYTERFGRVPKYSIWRRERLHMKRSRERQEDEASSFQGGRRRKRFMISQPEHSEHTRDRSFSHHHDDDFWTRDEHEWDRDEHVPYQGHRAVPYSHDVVSARRMRADQPVHDIFPANPSDRMQNEMGYHQSLHDEMRHGRNITMRPEGIRHGRATPTEGTQHGKVIQDAMYKNLHDFRSLTDELDVLKGKVQVLQKKNRCLERLLQTCLADDA